MSKWDFPCGIDCYANIKGVDPTIIAIFECVNRWISCVGKNMEDRKVAINFIISKLDNFLAPCSPIDHSSSAINKIPSGK